MSLAVSGTISGTSGNNTLTKSGNGTLLLSGPNTYGPAAGTAGTVLSAGTLELANSQALGLGDLTNTANATLQVDGSMTLANKIRIGSSSTLTLNDGGNTVLLAGGFTAAGSLAKTGSGLVLFTNLGTSTIGGFGADNGVLEIGAGMTLNGTANHLEYNQFQDAISASFGGSKQQIPLEYKQRSAEYWPERFTMPLAMTVGGQDRLVPPDSCRRLAGVLKQLGRPVLLLDRPEGGHDTNYEETLAALEFVILKARQTARQGNQPN